MSKREEIGQLSQKGDQEVRWQIEWAIDNIKLYRYKSNPPVSPSFSFFGFQWYLQMYPYGERDKNTGGWVGLYLCREDDSSSPIHGIVTFGVKNPVGEVVNRRHGDLSCTFGDKPRISGHPKFMRADNLWDDLELLSSDTLTLTCTLMVDDSSLTHSVQNTFSENFADLFISKRGCDATLKVQHQEFPAHKLILGARSPVFAAMFQADMQEKQTCTPDIKDCDPEVFEVFVLYLYTGKFECDSDKVFNLYRVAHKYDVVELESACVLSMMYHLTVETFYETAVFANEFCEDKLQRKTQLFFNDNFGKIVSTTDWESFLTNNVSLASGLLKNMASDKKL